MLFTTEAPPLTVTRLARLFQEYSQRQKQPASSRPVIVSPAEFISFTGCCPSCRRDLEEVAAADQQLARRQCSCGVFLPKDWRERLRMFAVASSWSDRVSRFNQWVPAGDDRITSTPLPEGGES